MKSQAAFVRPDRTVHLDAEAPVNVELAFIVLPWNPEHNDAFRLDDSFDDLGLAIFRMLLQDERERFDDFLDGLVKFRLGRIFGLHLGQQSRNVVFHKRWLRIGGRRCAV